MRNIFIFLIFNAITQAQDYVPFIQNGNVWRYSLSDSPMCYQNEDDRIDVEYDYTLGDDVIRNNEEFKELYVQYYFKSIFDFIERKNCDDEIDGGSYLIHLNINNYNTRHLIGYVKEDVQNKKVTINSIDYYGGNVYDYINNVRTLLAVNEVTKYNIDTKEYEYDYLGYSPNKYYLYEGIGDRHDFFKSTFDHIDPPFSGLYAFSKDHGTIFYTSNNQVLNVNEIDTDTFYTIINNPTDHFIQLNTITNIKTLKIVNNLGQLIFVQVKNFSKIDISKLVPGNYYLIIENDKNISKLKFIKK